MKTPIEILFSFVHDEKSYSFARSSHDARVHFLASLTDNGPLPDANSIALVVGYNVLIAFIESIEGLYMTDDEKNALVGRFRRMRKDKQ